MQIEPKFPRCRFVPVSTEVVLDSDRKALAGIALHAFESAYSGAYAQTTGPAGQQDKAGMTNSNSDAMKKDSTTTGMSNTTNKETGWSGISEQGTAYDGPAPKTTTGPAGSGSKTESPEK